MPSQEFDMNRVPNPSGLCFCGCGQTTPIAKRTISSRQQFKGEHIRYISGHNAIEVSPEARARGAEKRSGENNFFYGVGPNKGKYGKDAPNYKGGRVNRNGYWEILVHEGHRFFEMASKVGGSWYIQEHRLVMAEARGRPLTTEEEVHHIDEDRGNNDLANLLLFATKGEHRSHHERLKQLWPRSSTHTPTPPRFKCTSSLPRARSSSSCALTTPRTSSTTTASRIPSCTARR